MKRIDQYHMWVEWSEADHTYIGRCPDVITGIHGNDPVRLYAELYATVKQVLDHFEHEGRPLPPAQVRPMAEVR